MYSEKSIKIQSFIIYLLPICLVSGPFLPDLIVSLSSIYFLFNSIKNNNFDYFKNIFFKFFFIFWIYITLNSFFSSNLLISLKSSFFFIRFGIFSILIYYLLDKNKYFIKYFSLSLFVTFFVVLLDTYFQYFLGYNIFGMQSPQPNRLSSFFGDELIVGSFLSRLFPLIMAFGILMHEKGIKYINYICIIFLILTDVIIFLSGERTSFGLLVITNLLYIIYITRFKVFRIFGFAISIIIIIVFVMNDNILQKRMIKQTTKDLTQNLEYINPENKEKGLVFKEEKTTKRKIRFFSSVHESHYFTALNMFYDKLLFGVGPNMFRFECSKENYAYGQFNCTTHPHNLHIQILAEIGIIGYMFFLLPLLFLGIFFLKNLLRLNKKNSLLHDYNTCLSIAIFLTLFPLAPSGNFFHNWLGIIYFLPIGFFIHAQLRKDEY